MKLFAKLKTYLTRLKNASELRKSFIYLFASTTAFGLVFVQNFSLAYFSSINFYGRITLSISLFSTLYVIFTCGLNAVVLRFYFDKKFNSNQKGLISNVTTIWLVFGFGLTLLGLVAGYFAIEWKGLLPLDYYTEFVPILLGSFFYSFTEIFPNIFIAEEKPIKYALCIISCRFLIFVLLHVSVFVFGESSSYIAIMLLVSGSTLCISGLFIFKVLPLSAIHWGYVKEIFIYALPLMIYALGGIGYSHGYRVIISSWLTYSDLAIFSLASQMALVYYLTASSSVTGFYPRAYRALEQHQGDPRSIRFYAKLLLGIGIGLMLLIAPFSYLFLKFFKDGAFETCLNILPILLLGQFFFLLYSYNYVLCTFYKETKILTYSMVAGVGISLFLAWILLKEADLWGAAVAVATGLFIQFLTSYALVQRVVRKAGYKKII